MPTNNYQQYRDDLAARIKHAPKDERRAILEEAKKDPVYWESREEKIAERGKDGGVMKTFIEIFGWYGTVAIISAYALVSFGYLLPTSLAYQVMNGTGALGIVLVSFKKRAYQPGVLNTIWAVIALVAISRIMM